MTVPPESLPKEENASAVLMAFLLGQEDGVPSLGLGCDDVPVFSGLAAGLDRSLGGNLVGGEPDGARGAKSAKS